MPRCTHSVTYRSLTSCCLDDGLHFLMEAPARLAVAKLSTCSLVGPGRSYPKKCIQWRLYSASLQADPARSDSLWSVEVQVRRVFLLVVVVAACPV